MSPQTGTGHLEHWQRQESAEAAQRELRRSRVEANLQRKDLLIENLQRMLREAGAATRDKDCEIRQLKDQLAVAADSVQKRSGEIRCLENQMCNLTQSLGALSTTVANLCELQNANRVDEVLAEIKRLADNYAQIKAAVTARRVH